MKKAVIILLIIVVLGIVGFFVYNEISVKELSYVTTVEKDDENGRYYIKRLYSSNIDIDAFNDRIENLLMLEFTEDDIQNAALEAGTPEFYPALHILTYRPDLTDRELTEEERNCVYIDITAVQELAKGQEYADYSMTNLKMEVLTSGVSIIEAQAVGRDSLNREINESILKNESGTGMVAELNDYGTANLKLKGTTGSVTFQFTYDIKKNSIIPTTALTGCFTMIRADIATNEEGQTRVTYTSNPITSVEEYIEQ